MVGQKRSINHIGFNTEDNLSVPPGFVSLTSLTLRKIVNASAEGELEPGSVGDPLSNSDIKRIKTSLTKRPWISHRQFERVQHQDDTEQIEVTPKDPTGASLRKGVIRGCADCPDCVKVIARWHPEDSYLPVLDDAPVFRPTEEEFKDTLKYIAYIRTRADRYGICRIVPPPSWNPPFLLENKKIWEASEFSTHVQMIHGLQNLVYRRKRSRLHENIKTEMPEDAASVELKSCNECVGDSEEPKAIGLVSDFESGPEFTLKSFKKYADDFKVQYFRDSDTVVTGQKQREPLIARIESEYWRIVENPSEEIEVLFGTDFANQTIASGFPPADSPAKDMDKYVEYVKSGWNLNNTSGLYGSVLRFGCYNSSTVSVPQMSVGMCFASQCWRNEDHHLYSLSYIHTGSPKVWYSIPGKYSSKFMELVKKLFPKLSKHPKLLYEIAGQLSPSMLKSKGLPVYRCLQNPSEFIITFPGAYHSEFSCGFNCSEAVCFAPLDWLPHGQKIMEVYSAYCVKTSLSHDKLLVEAATEAVASEWDSLINKSDPSKIRLWRSVSGKNGILTRLLKVRVQNEGMMRKHLCKMMNCSTLDESDDIGIRECCFCLCDLYLSSVACPCSPNKYSCLRHVKQLCSCGWSSKQFRFRYEMRDLELLIEALEGNLKAIHIWPKKKDAVKRNQKKDPNGVVASTKRLTPLVDLANREKMRIGSSGSTYDRNAKARDKHLVQRPGGNGGGNEESLGTIYTSPPPVSSLQNALYSSAKRSEKSLRNDNVIVLSDNED